MNKLGILLLLGVWLGLVLGLSFLEAPLKFQAPGITTELGLGIGRLVFGALNKIEIVFSLLLIVGHWKVWRELEKLLLGALVAILFIVAIQSFVLLPVLHERIEKILAGEVVLPSKHHISYIVLEAMKVAALFFAFLKTYKRISKALAK